MKIDGKTVAETVDMLTEACSQFGYSITAKYPDEKALVFLDSVWIDTRPGDLDSPRIKSVKKSNA